MKYLKRFKESEEYYRNHLENAKEAFKGDMEFQKMLRDTSRDYLTYLVDNGFAVMVQDTQLDGKYFDIDIAANDYKPFKISDIIDDALPFILYLESGGLERVKLTGVFIYFHDGPDRRYIGSDYSTLPDLELGDVSCFSIAVEKF